MARLSAHYTGETAAFHFSGSCFILKTRYETNITLPCWETWWKHLRRQISDNHERIMSQISAIITTTAARSLQSQDWCSGFNSYLRNTRAHIVRSKTQNELPVTLKRALYSNIRSHGRKIQQYNKTHLIFLVPAVRIDHVCMVSGLYFQFNLYVSNVSPSTKEVKCHKRSLIEWNRWGMDPGRTH